MHQVGFVIESCNSHRRERNLPLWYCVTDDSRNYTFGLHTKQNRGPCARQLTKRVRLSHGHKTAHIRKHTHTQIILINSLVVNRMPAIQVLTRCTSNWVALSSLCLPSFATSAKFALQVLSRRTCDVRVRMSGSFQLHHVLAAASGCSV